MLLGDRNAEQADAMQVAIILDREGRLAIVGRGATGEHALADLAGARDDIGLLVAQAECGGIEDRCVKCDLVIRADGLADLHGHCAVTSCCRDGVQKPAESPVKGIRLFEVSEMPGAGKLDIFCGRNVRRGFRHHRGRRVVVSGAGQQQRRHGNILERAALIKSDQGQHHGAIACLGHARHAFARKLYAPSDRDCRRPVLSRGKAPAISLSPRDRADRAVRR